MIRRFWPRHEALFTFSMLSSLDEKNKNILGSAASVHPRHKNTLLTVLAAARDINCLTKLAGN